MDEAKKSGRYTKVCYISMTEEFHALIKKRAIDHKCTMKKWVMAAITDRLFLESTQEELEKLK